MSTIDAFALAKAKLMQQLGMELTDAQVQAYLDGSGMTPEAWLERDAELSASIIDAPARIPDQEKDPEGYQYYLESQYPPGL